ncbi:TIR domain-containing protein [Rhizomicrobium electricum]|uniref:TIR domain-containing protein n=1 Tax=Rhizomicrobium electricum TaxID=480070 RepID=A0ABP3Q5N7_9PROT|nr:WD40 repeat protein [Rhizomicrobium electricum]
MAGKNEKSAFKYAAYICYSHKDEEIAAWLHRCLERYSIPGGVAPGYGKRALWGRRLGRIFRDREELPAGQPLAPKLFEALAASEALIVLCSPNAAASLYVNDEIAEFRRLGKGRIIPVIVEGDPPGCYPPALEAAGENLNADLRSGRDGRENGAIKIIAGMLGVNPDDLVHRERRAQRQRLALAGLGMTVFAGMAVAAGWFWQQSEANTQKANNALNRFVAIAAESAVKHGDPLLAMRYALAGMKLAPANGPEYHDVLLSALDATHESRVLEGHTGSVNSVVFSHDGRRIATGSADGTLRIWDVKSGSQTHVLATSRTNIVESVVFSLDGAQVAAGNSDGFIRVWNVATGKLIREFFTGRSSISTISFSPDGSRIVSGGLDHNIQIWDWRTGIPAAMSLVGHKFHINAVIYSPDGSRIFSASDDKTIRIWNSTNGKQIGLILDEGVARSLTVSPDGSRVVTGDGDNVIRIWDAKTGRKIGPPLEGHTGVVGSVAYSPDGSQIVSAGWDGTIRIWNAHTGKQIGDALAGHTSTVRSVGYSPDGRTIVSGSWDSTVRLWDARIDKQISATLLEGTSFSCFAFSVDGSRIVSGDFNAGIRIWDTKTGHQVGAPFIGHTDEISSVAISPDAQRLASGSRINPVGMFVGRLDATVRIWDVRTRSQVGSPLTALKGGARSIAFSRDGNLIASGSGMDWSGAGTGSRDASIVIWNAHTGKQIGSSLSGHDEEVSSVAFSTDGRYLVSGDIDNAIRIWDVRSGKQIGAPLTGHTSPVESVAFSPDGSRVVSGSGDNTVRLWDARTGKQVGAPLTGHTAAVSTVAFSTDGSRIVSGGWDNTIRIWDTRTGKQIGEPLKGHADAVVTVVFLPNDHRIVSADYSGRILHWDSSLYVKDWAQAATEACNIVLGSGGRRFSAAEIQNDPLLQAEWPDPTRDVCEGIPGVPPLPGAKPKLSAPQRWLDQLRTYLSFLNKAN